MRHFQRIASGIELRPFLDELAANAELWDVDTSRQEKIVTQSQTRTITLRAHAARASLDSRVRRAKPVSYRGRASEMAVRLPVASRFVDELARGMHGTLGRAVMTNLRPHGAIARHTDDGLYWLLRDRYHLVVKSAAGSRLTAGEEEVRMQEGELWWFDPTVPHQAFNDSDEDRIHIIVDVLSRRSLRTFRRRLLRAPLRSLRAFGDVAARRVVWAFRRLASPAEAPS